MKYREYSQVFLDKIENFIISFKMNNPGPAYAAFDADGTLWPEDASEAFFSWQIESKLIELPDNPMKYYLDWKAKDPVSAYFWLAQINSGKSLETIRDWAKSCKNSLPEWTVFESQKKLIEILRKHQIDVYVVTASVKWAVEPFAELLGIDQKYILGVETEVHNGIITDRPVQPCTYKQGKAEKLLLYTRGVRPIFCAGNTLGDEFLLRSSQGLVLCVRSAQKESHMYDVEDQLWQLAKSSNWLMHDFTCD